MVLLKQLSIFGAKKHPSLFPHKLTRKDHKYQLSEANLNMVYSPLWTDKAD